LIVDVLGRIGHIRPIGQPHRSPTPYTYRLKKEDGRIDWTKTPEDVERFIRAMSPWPSARTSITYQVVSSKGKQEKTIKDVTILKAHLERDDSSSLLPTPPTQSQSAC
jgi:methionyl-tRNA formyltransferase